MTIAKSHSFDKGLEDWQAYQAAPWGRLRYQYGIRAICDFIANNDLKYDSDFYQKLETLELALSDNEPYKFLARFYHFIAQKGQQRIR
jgi:hypothetical protein